MASSCRTTLIFSLTFSTALGLAAHGFEVSRIGCGSTQGGALDFFVNLVPVHGNRTRRINADLHLVASNIDNHERDVISNHDLFIAFATEYEHGTSLSCLRSDWVKPVAVGHFHGQLVAKPDTPGLG